VNNTFRGESKGVPITPFDSSRPYTWACYGPYTSLPLCSYTNMRGPLYKRTFAYTEVFVADYIGTC
jgi:hypothetical protein